MDRKLVQYSGDNQKSKKVISLLVLLIPILISACTPSAEFTPTQSINDEAHPTFIPTSTQAEEMEPTAIDLYDEERNQMVTQTIERRGVEDEDVLRAMRAVPRHEFVLSQYLDQAYADHPLPIGFGQTISQPYIVAWMTELLGLETGDKVLEIGTGSGYQAAVLSELGFVDVYTIEIVPELAESAAARLASLGYEEVQAKHGDGYYGWKEYEPFDAIIVTAAPDHLPAPLVEQLSKDGRIVIPIGPPGGYQTLWKFVLEDDKLVGYNIGGVRFVPFTGEGIEGGHDAP